MLRGLLRGTDLLILVVGLGGGTGSGAAPVVARTAKEVGALVLCVATLPFSFEGDGRRRNARASLRDLREPADAVVVQPNDRLLEIAPEGAALVEAFNAADRMLAIGVRALWSMLLKPGVINITFADLSHLIQYAAGTCTFGFGEGEGPGSAEGALAELLESPLLEKGSQLTRAAALLVCITAGPDLRLSDVQRIMDEINSLACAGAHAVLGVVLDTSWAQRTAVAVWVAEEWGIPESNAAEAQTEPRTGERVSLGVSSGVQGQLNLGDLDKGRFRDVEPTLYEGQDLDVPTFLRRGVKLSFDRG
jgi:cell division protein FtsZ